MTKFNRRSLIKASLGTAVAAGFPAIVPASVFGQNAPSNRITIGAIGYGRIGRDADVPSVLRHDIAQIVAVCDIDKGRLADGKKRIEDHYSKKTGKAHTGVKTFENYRDLLADKSIDAVLVSTPDHWHALNAVHAVNAGKDVYLQKPASLTIAEGKMLVKAVKKSGRIVQIGSQQRSWKQFREAAELVRNGRIGDLTHVEIGLPGDPSGGNPAPMPVPYNLNYDAWLGSTPEVPYTVDRVHPQVGYGRPGWLRLRQFGSGMITGWGSHHIDSAHWGMNTEFTGPIEVWGEAEFPTSGLWDVHGNFKSEALYANGVRMTISGKFTNGIKYIGTKGWIFVSRGDQKVTASDPGKPSTTVKALDASDPAILTSKILPTEINLYRSDDHYGNWLDCIRSRKTPITPAELGHRGCSTCLIHDIAMILKRKVKWDPVKEVFINDPEANALMARPMRKPYVF